jgi:hypothetical protein
LSSVLMHFAVHSVPRQSFALNSNKILRFFSSAPKRLLL